MSALNLGIEKCIARKTCCMTWLLIFAITMLMLTLFMGSCRISEFRNSYMKSYVIDYMTPNHCYCKFGSKLYSMCYSPYFNLELFGEKFNCSFLEFLNEAGRF